MENRPTQKELSVIVAAVEASRPVTSCLESIRVSCSEIDAEIILVAAGSDPEMLRAAEEFANVSVVSLDSGLLVPRLWSEGISLATGTVVALLTAHCVVSARWAPSFIDAISEGAVAAGGPIALADGASLLDSAIFFLRYSAFVGRPQEGHIAGENAAYLRSAIPARWTREDGFWELGVNTAIIEQGGSIAWCEDAWVAFGNSFSLASICRHRFAHGRLFGRERVASGREGKVRIMIAAPVVPLALAFRAARKLVAARRHLMRFAASLPLFLLIASFWAAGEATGAAEG